MRVDDVAGTDFSTLGVGRGLGAHGRGAVENATAPTDINLLFVLRAFV